MGVTPAAPEPERCKHGAQKWACEDEQAASGEDVPCGNCGANFSVTAIRAYGDRRAAEAEARAERYAKVVEAAKAWASDIDDKHDPEDPEDVRGGSRQCNRCFVDYQLFVAVHALADAEKEKTMEHIASKDCPCSPTVEDYSHAGPCDLHENCGAISRRDWELHAEMFSDGMDHTKCCCDYILSHKP